MVRLKPDPTAAVGSALLPVGSPLLPVGSALVPVGSAFRRTFANCSANVSFTQAGGVRRRSIPNNFSFIQRPGLLDATLFDSGAKWLPILESARTLPSTRLPSGMPCLRQCSARNSLLKRATSTPTGHSALHARHSRQRSSVSSTPSSPSPASASRPVIARRSVFARPRVTSFSSRVAMYDGHIVPSSFLRQAPTPLHISTARPKPPYSE